MTDTNVRYFNIDNPGEELPDTYADANGVTRCVALSPQQYGMMQDALQNGYKVLDLIVLMTDGHTDITLGMNGGTSMPSFDAEPQEPVQ